MKDLQQNSVLVVTTTSRSVSPLTPSPSREIRGLRLFRAISRKLGRRSNEDLNYGEDDSRSSSTDSCSSTSTGRTKNSCSEDDFDKPNMSSGSSNGSEENNLNRLRHRHHHSSTATSFRKVFESLSLNHNQQTTPTHHQQRSQSCETIDKKSKKNVPKRILRTPVTYTYVRGMSGLPTQRIPRSTQQRLYNSNCYCGYENSEDDCRSSSTDSCSSTSTGRTKNSCSEDDFDKPNMSSGSSNGSEENNLNRLRHRHHHSSTATSFRKVFESLSLNHNQQTTPTHHQQRSQSCETIDKKSKKNVPKRILRTPVTYTYVRGMSGLPTQRIPRSTQQRLYNSNCYCGYENREDDSRSSSTDSCSSMSTGRTKNSCSEDDFDKPNMSSGSSNGSEENNLNRLRHRHHHSSTATSFRKVFESLSLNHNQQTTPTHHQQRSQSCETIDKKSKKNVPKRILRTPVTYTYVRGMSGLPTQRIPRSTQQRLYNSNCYCGYENRY